MQKVLITGGNKGIGFAITTCFLHNGYDLVIVARDFSAFPHHAPQVQQVRFDLRHYRDIPRLVSEIGAIDILVNNAGLLPARPYDHLSLSRLNYQWPAWEVHPAMMEGGVARPLCVQRGLKGWNEVLQLVHRHPGDRQERGRARLQARARSTSQRGGLLASEASWTINRDKLT
jgi:NAD(P)-dependent dehydrogenase (short-subunit alcohol dehydrogenase family)